MPYARKTTRKRPTALRRRKATRTTRPRPVRSMRPAGSKGGFTIVRKVSPLSLSALTSATFGFTADVAGGAVPVNWVIGTPTSYGTTHDVPFAMGFALKDLVAYAELTTIADRYKINKIWVRFYFNSQTSLTASTTGNVPAPMIEYIQDHDDVIPDTVVQFRERMGTKMAIARNNGYIQVAINPSILQNTTTGSTVVKFGQFLDCEAPAVVHYGLKGVFKGMPSNIDIPLCRIDVAYSVSLKNLQ